MKITMKRLKEIIREELINEKVFGSQAQYDAYRKKHNLKPGTKVKVAGKTITVRGKGKLSKKAKSTADRMADKLNKKMDALNKKRTQAPWLMTVLALALAMLTIFIPMYWYSALLILGIAFVVYGMTVKK